MELIFFIKNKYYQPIYGFILCAFACVRVRECGRVCGRARSCVSKFCSLQNEHNEYYEILRASGYCYEQAGTATSE